MKWSHVPMMGVVLISCAANAMQVPTLLNHANPAFAEFFETAQRMVLEPRDVEHILSQPDGIMEQLEALRTFFVHPMLHENQSLILTTWACKNGFSLKFIANATTTKRKQALHKFTGNQNFREKDLAESALMCLQFVKDQIERTNDKH